MEDFDVMGGQPEENQMMGGSPVIPDEFRDEEKSEFESFLDQNGIMLDEQQMMALEIVYNELGGFEQIDGGIESLQNGDMDSFVAAIQQSTMADRLSNEAMEALNMLSTMTQEENNMPSSNQMDQSMQQQIPSDFM